MTRQPHQERTSTADAGFALVGAIVMVFLMLLVLSIAAPRVAADLKRDREVESVHRAQQYTRAIRIYYKKFNHYPGSVEQLEKSNNQRFLRQKYLDPLTGKDDWRLIHVGENKTKVKGFFGEELQGLAGGLGSAAGLASPTGGSTTGGSAFNNSGLGGASSGALGGGSVANPGGGVGGTGTTGSSSGTGSSTGGSGISSQNATDAGGSGGPIMGIGSSRTGESIVIVNEQTNYQEWEFLYDPRIEQLYAKSTLLGGISSGTGSGSSGFGTPIGGTPPGGAPPGGNPLGGTQPGSPPTPTSPNPPQ